MIAYKTNIYSRNNFDYYMFGHNYDSANQNKYTTQLLFSYGTNKEKRQLIFYCKIFAFSYCKWLWKCLQL